MLLDVGNDWMQNFSSETVARLRGGFRALEGAAIQPPLLLGLAAAGLRETKQIAESLCAVRGSEMR